MSPALASPAARSSGDDALDRLGRAYGAALEVLTGAIARHDGCNMSGRDLCASRSPTALRYTRQAADVLDDLRLPGLELVAAARRAVADHVLFGGPHDLAGSLDAHEPTRRLLELVVTCGAHLAEAVA